MSENITPTASKRGGTVLGVCLLALGSVLLLAQIADIHLTGRFWSFIWPFFVITPGALLLFVVTREGGKMADAAAIIGGSAYGVRWLRRKLPPLFAQVRRGLALVKLYIERGGTSAVAPIIATRAAVAQLRAWSDYVAGLVREVK